MTRIRTFLASLVAVVAATACGASPSPGHSGKYLPGFNPPAKPTGYTRFVTPVVHGIDPGTDILWCQWIAPPAAADKDVLDVTGLQSKYGHHVALYATTLARPVGTTHECTNDDMVSIRFLGAVGVEGTVDVYKKLGGNIGMRLRKGEALLANTHFLNTGDKPIDGQAVLDVKFADPDPNRQLAAFMVNTTTNIDIEPNTPTTQDLNCTSQADLPVVLAANHMHEYGRRMFTEIKRAGGGTDMLVDDESWSDEQTFDPRFVSFDKSKPFMIHKGDVIHTHCEWVGDPTKRLRFPDEMCAGLSFYLAPAGTPGTEYDCVDGTWPQGN